MYADALNVYAIVADSLFTCAYTCSHDLPFLLFRVAHRCADGQRPRARPQLEPGRVAVARRRLRRALPRRARPLDDRGGAALDRQLAASQRQLPAVDRQWVRAR